MMSNVKKKDVPLISISLGTHSFHRSCIKPFPTTPTDAQRNIHFCYAYVRFRRTGIGFAGNGTGDLFSHQ